MDPFTAFLVYAVLFIAVELLRPKPNIEDAKAATFEEFQIPTTDPKRPIPVIWGRTRVKSPGIVWYGDYRTLAIEEEVRTGLFSKQDVVTGYHYNIGVQLGICREVDSFEAFDWDDERLVTFSPELVPPVAGSLVNINEPDFLGGDEGAAAGGGIVGDFRFFRGGLGQLQSGYLAQFQTDVQRPNIPAYRHLAMCVYEGPQIGTQPVIKAPAFIVKRHPNGLGLPAFEAVVGTGANPCNVIFELMTNDDFGLTIDAADINTANFSKIAGRLALELHSYSNNWAQKSETKDVIDNILRQIDATLFMEFTTGQFEMRLIREPGTESPDEALIILDESNIVEIDSFRRVNWAETTNRIVVNWKDPEQAQTPSPAVQDDMANQRIQGRNVIATFNHPGIDNAVLAAQVAARQLRAGSFPSAVVSLIANRDAIDLRPGDAFEFQWDELGITSMIMRVLAVKVGSSTEIRVRIDAIQDVYALGESVYAAPGDTLWFNPATAPPVATLADKAFEAPLLLDRLSPIISPITSATEDGSRIVLLPVQNQQNVISWRMMFGGPGSPASADTVVEGDFAQMCPSAILVDPISIGQFIDPLSPNTIHLTGFNNFRDLTAATSVDIIAQLANLFIIDDEFMSFETATLLADGNVQLNNVHRAKLDSLPVAHALTSPGKRVFFMGLNLLFAGGLTDVRYGNGVSGAVSARPNTTRGRLSVAAATVVQFTSTARIIRPYPPSNLEIEVPAVSSESPAVANSPAFAADFFFNRLNLPRGDFIFTWDNRDRTDQTDQDYDTTTAQALEAATEIAIEVHNDALSPTLQRTITSTSETATYLVSQQDTDFGGPGSPVVSPAVQAIRFRIFTRRTDSPALESEQAYGFTINRTV